MSKVLNTNSRNDLPEATDQECLQRRRLLIGSGVITPSTDSLLKRPDGSLAVPTNQYSANLRATLINNGIINPDLISLPERDRSKPVNIEEGEYKPRPIANNNEYMRRKQAYFRILQEVLKSRVELNLNLGPKKNTDPDWYF